MRVIGGRIYYVDYDSDPEESYLIKSMDITGEDITTIVSSTTNILSYDIHDEDIYYLTTSGIYVSSLEGGELECVIEEASDFLI